MSSPNNNQNHNNAACGDKTRLQQNVTTNLNKCHKVEGKNRKSLYQKQRQQKQEATGKQQNLTPKLEQNTSNSPNNSKKNRPLDGSAPQDASKTKQDCNLTVVSSTLDQFSKRAQELKVEIHEALEKQASLQQEADQSVEVVKLKNDIIKLADLKETSEEEAEERSLEGNQECFNNNDDSIMKLSSQDKNDNTVNEPMGKLEPPNSTREAAAEYKSVVEFNQALDAYNVNDEINHIDIKENSKSKGSKKRHTHSSLAKQAQEKAINNQSDEFELLEAKLDSKSKCVALVSGLQKRFEGSAPNELLDSVCHKLVNVSEQNKQLVDENQRLNKIKQKLENICRELQKSNNEIRIESLDLIKAEQGKAKNQTAKIQSTLSGVVSLFDENQKRNMSLRQENSELQTKLKSLLDHCDNWEKSVEAALRQRDIENRLLKTELAKESLLKNEEKEKFLVEKQELLKILSMMQEQQHRIEGQEKKLRSDLSSYANKYDECQAVINKGMSRFKEESSRMLQEIQKWREDYKNLLAKYEASKQTWDKAMSQKNKKIETLEKLCRALSERKVDTCNSNVMTPATTTNAPTASAANDATGSNNNTNKA